MIRFPSDSYTHWFWENVLWRTVFLNFTTVDIVMDTSLWWGLSYTLQFADLHPWIQPTMSRNSSSCGKIKYFSPYPQGSSGDKIMSDWDHWPGVRELRSILYSKLSASLTQFITLEQPRNTSEPQICKFRMKPIIVPYPLVGLLQKMI